MIGATYSQNLKTLEDYYTALDAGRLPVYRGIALSHDDRLRREVITRLICHFRLTFETIESVYGIRFREYFADELAGLQAMQSDGLLSIDATGITVAPVGKLLIRNICMVFDRYLSGASHRFSKVI